MDAKMERHGHTPLPQPQQMQQPQQQPSQQKTSHPQPSHPKLPQPSQPQPSHPQPPQPSHPQPPQPPQPSLQEPGLQLDVTSIDMLISRAQNDVVTDEEARALQAAASYNDEAAGYLVYLAQYDIATDDEQRALCKAAGAGNTVALSYMMGLHEIAVATPEEEQAIAQAAACGNSAAIEFVEGRGESRERRQQLDELNAWYQKHQTHRGEMHRRHKEERKCSTALLTNDELAVLPPPSEEDTYLYKEALRHGDFGNMVFLPSPWFGIGTPEAAESLPPGQTPALPAWVRGELLKARQKREWAAMNSISEERQRFPDGGSAVEIHARIEELVVIEAIKRQRVAEEARKENSCAVL
eukprot:Transcript_20572.p1 GENE.Transcript_20572~~Transcript_20572.p1  ORF type:complete len:416 (-),score=53.00 Transcript_20572:91-1152(-)